MLSFSVFAEGKPLDKPDLSGAYVVGSDEVPLRAEITAESGLILCKKRAAGPAGLALLWPVDSVGRILLETIRVQERQAPYVLQVELARGRLLRLANKIEDWGLHDYPPASSFLAQVDEARELLIKALQAGGPAEAASLGDRSLAVAVTASERLTLLHAELFSSRRKQSVGFSRRVFGLGIEPVQSPGSLARDLAASCDFVSLPIQWRAIEPAEQTYDWKQLDGWIEQLTKQRILLHAGPLLSFGHGNIPDRHYIWEHDFDTIRDLAFEHIRRVMNRYGQHVQSWTAVSGLHGENAFSFNFEQIMELTRMACALTKQLSPRGTTMIELVCPWGEYYARNQRTIPPLLYADMTVQSGVAFDAFALRIRFGPATDGTFVRDMFQVSAMLDQFSKLGKPLHVTGVQVPSSTEPTTVQGDDGTTVTRNVDGGVWHASWSESVQADWVRAFVNIALSKPFVESVSWETFADHPNQAVPHGGLTGASAKRKSALNQWTTMRNQLVGRGAPEK